MESLICSTSTPVVTASAMDDVTLLTRYRAGDQSVFPLLLERHAAVVRGVCRRRLGDSQASDDAAQAVFVVLANKARSIREPQALPAWLHRTALHACDHVQRSQERRHHRERQAGAAMAREHLMSSSSPVQDDEWEEIRPHLDAAVQDLRPAQRDAVIGFYLHGKAQAVVAAELGCSEAAVKMRLQDALEKLRITLSRRGVTIGVVALAGVLANQVSAAAVEQGFTAACMSAVEGGASPAVQAISNKLLFASTMKAVAWAGAAAVVIAASLVVISIDRHERPVSSPPLLQSIQLADVPPASTETQNQDKPVNILIPMTLAIAAATNLSAAANDGATPPVAPLNAPSPSNGNPGQGGLSNANANPAAMRAMQAQMAQSRTSAFSNPPQWGMGLGQDVELVVITSTSTGGDAQGLARWAELAAEGYQIGQVVSEANHFFLFLQRNHVGQQTYQLPSTVEKDQALAKTIQDKIKAYWAARGLAVPQVHTMTNGAGGVTVVVGDDAGAPTPTAQPSAPQGPANGF